jgi:hypothetical protein
MSGLAHIIHGRQRRDRRSRAQERRHSTEGEYRYLPARRPDDAGPADRHRSPGALSNRGSWSGAWLQSRQIHHNHRCVNERYSANPYADPGMRPVTACDVSGTAFLRHTSSAAHLVGLPRPGCGCGPSRRDTSGTNRYAGYDVTLSLIRAVHSRGAGRSSVCRLRSNVHMVPAAPVKRFFCHIHRGPAG